MANVVKKTTRTTARIERQVGSWVGNVVKSTSTSARTKPVDGFQVGRIVKKRTAGMEREVTLFRKKQPQQG
jgi:hypothetical protein